MSERNENRLGAALEVCNQVANEDTLTPIQARAFVRGVQVEWEVPLIRWDERESGRQYEDANRLLHAASVFEEIEGVASSNAIRCYQRAGELLEWLSRAGDHIETFIPLEMLAAASYQLGQLPAMASALLGRISGDSPGEELYSSFLRCDFDAVLKGVALFWQENFSITVRDAPTRLLSEESEDKVSWFFTVELVRSLGLISDSLRRGDELRLNLAIKKLAALDKLALRIFSDEASMLVLLLHQVAKSYSESSIYVPIRSLSELNPRRAHRMEAFARTQFSHKRGILWTSQKHGVSRLIENSSFALCTPTGSGKTLVANLALLKELLLCEDDGLAPLGLYLVPSRALAGEVEAKLTSELGRDFIVTGLYGGADWGVTDYWLNADQPTVLVATVEKADALMRYLAPYLLTRLRLLIVDEAHQVVPDDSERAYADFAEHTSRPVRLESFVSRLLSHLPDIARIALTAVAGGAAQPVSRWIEGTSEAEAIGTNYRSTRQIIGALKTMPGSSSLMTFEILNGRRLRVSKRAGSIYIPLRIPPMQQLPPEMRNSIYRFNELSILWAALHLARTGRRILISVAQQPEKTMGWYRAALELPDWQEALAFHLPDNDSHRGRYEEARLACRDYCGDNSFELALLDRGIASNHGQMPQRLRRLMIDLIERGICLITVATATLTEGVNLPFDIIFVTSLIRSSFDSVNKKPVESPMSVSEFRNLSGRAGRPGSSNGIEGLTLVALPQHPSATAQGKIQLQRRQIASLQDNFSNLMAGLLAEEPAANEVNSPLTLLLHRIALLARTSLGLEGEAFSLWLESVTPVDISAAVGQASSAEEARLADSIDELDGVLLSAIEEIERLNADELTGLELERSLAGLWQRTFSFYAAAQEDWLERTFVRRGIALVERIYPDEQERSRLYQYGFTPQIGRGFEIIVPDIRAIIQQAGEYGASSSEDRVSVFEGLGALLVEHGGYGFRIRDSDTDRRLLRNWIGILRWWMKVPGAEMPIPNHLRSWQRFVSENIDFRLGVAVGAVVASAWSEGADDPFEIPSLAAWRETTGLPWFGFWVRELLRWGTLDPFVAFALAQGLAKTRDEAAARRPEFEEWLATEVEADGVNAESLIDPQLFLAWQRTLLRQGEREEFVHSVAADLTGTTGQKGTYRVVPVLMEDHVAWMDAAGYFLARSDMQDVPFHGDLYHHDFELRTTGEQPIVERVFS